MSNSPFGFVGPDPEASRTPRPPRAAPVAAHPVVPLPRTEAQMGLGPDAERPRRREPRRFDPNRPRTFRGGGDWESLGPISPNPDDVAHFERARELVRRLDIEFDIQPEKLYPTKDRRGVVKLDLPQLYGLIYHPEDQPELLVSSLDPDELISRSRKRITPSPGGRFNDPRSRLHAAEVEELREVLAEEFHIYPRSAVPTRDMRGRVELTFDEVEKILDEAEEPAD